MRANLCEILVLNLGKRRTAIADVHCGDWRSSIYYDPTRISGYIGILIVEEEKALR